MPGQYTLKKHERLKSRKLIEQLFRRGKSFSFPPYRIFYMIDSREKEDTGPAVLFGAGVSARNFRRAVDRNRVKRLTREAYRLQKTGLQNKMLQQNIRLSVFFIYTGKELPAYADVYEKLGLILKKLESVADKKDRTGS